MGYSKSSRNTGQTLFGGQPRQKSIHDEIGGVLFTVRDQKRGETLEKRGGGGGKNLDQRNSSLRMTRRQLIDREGGERDRRTFPVFKKKIGIAKKGKGGDRHLKKEGER